MPTGQGGHGLRATPNDNQFSKVRSKIAAVLNKNAHLSHQELEQVMALIVDGS